MIAVRGWLVLLLWGVSASVVEAGGAEFRPTVAGGYSHIVEGHGSLSAALRVQVVSVLFVQAEYLALVGDGHTDHGPTLLAGISGRNRDGLRPFIGVGGGPVKGYQGDDGLAFLAVGVSRPIGRSRGAFLQGEFRGGLLGESAYYQVTLGIGLSR